jgi:hypothetical protein
MTFMKGAVYNTSQSNPPKIRPSQKKQITPDGEEIAFVARQLEKS